MSSVTVTKIESQPEQGCLSLPGVEEGGGCCTFFPFNNCTVDTPNGPCHCDKSCYSYDDCCDDILEIGCAGNLRKAFFVYMNK